MKAFVVYFNEEAPGSWPKEQRRIDSVFDSEEIARVRVSELERLDYVIYADYDEFELRP